MNLFGLMETSGSAMQAERMRAEVVAANMANAETTRTASGGPYQPPARGVRGQSGRFELEWRGDGRSGIPRILGWSFGSGGDGDGAAASFAGVRAVRANPRAECTSRRSSKIRRRR